LSHCGSSSGGGGSTPGLTVTGTASTGFDNGTTASLEKSRLEEGVDWIYRALIHEAWAALPASIAMASAHVNICTFTSGAFIPLPAHPTILADANGAFSVSASYSDV